MQKFVTALLDFLKLSPEKKVPIGTNMANGITNHPDVFTNPPTKGTDLTKLNNELTEADSKARSGDHEAEADRDNVEKRWDIAFRGAAKYVGGVANGNEAIIRQGGCTPTKSETTPTQLPGDCKNVQALPTPGRNSLTIGCDADTAIKAFVMMARTKGITFRQDGNMIIVEAGEERAYFLVDTHRKATFHNLPSDVRVWASMMAVNNAGCGPQSPETGVTPQ